MAISIIRTILLFALIMVCTRIMGKRQLGELEPSELVVAIMLSDIAVHPLQDPGIPLLYGVVPVLTLLCCEIFVSYMVVKNITLRAIICGKPSIIIDGGKINQKEMAKNRLTLDELTVELRKQNVTDINMVKYAILESDGSLSIMLRAGDSPATPNQMSLSVDDPGLPVMLISDGRTLQNNLEYLNLNEAWLKNELKKRNISQPEDVYIFMTDSSGNIYFSLKEG